VPHEVGTLAVDGWAVTFGTTKRGLGGAPARPGPSTVLNVTAHPSTASVPITVLLYTGLLLYGFNVSLKGQNSAAGCFMQRRCLSVCSSVASVSLMILHPWKKKHYSVKNSPPIKFMLVAGA